VALEFKGLDYLEAHLHEWGIESLACPPLGCGNGGLGWRVVGPLLYNRLGRLEIPVTLFAPFGTPPEELTPDFLGHAPTGIEASGVDEDGR
jgi:hypothetical protein